MLLFASATDRITAWSNQLTMLEKKRRLSGVKSKTRSVLGLQRIWILSLFISLQRKEIKRERLVRVAYVSLKVLVDDEGVEGCASFIAASGSAWTQYTLSVLRCIHHETVPHHGIIALGLLVTAFVAILRYGVYLVFSFLLNGRSRIIIIFCVCVFRCFSFGWFIEWLGFLFTIKYRFSTFAIFFFCARYIKRWELLSSSINLVHR